jgi:NarL family two-component system response regulator YdfI
LIRVVVIAPTLALRVGLRGLLSDAQAILVDGEAADLDEFELLNAEADVLVLASVSRAELRELAGASGPALLLLTDERRDAQTLVGTSRTWGVLPLNASEEELGAAVRALGEGLFVGAPTFVRGLLTKPASIVELADAEPLADPLTSREIEVLQLTAQGMANKQIAVALGISEHTVKFHLSSLYNKLGAASRTEAIHIGTRRGLITL